MKYQKREAALLLNGSLVQQSWASYTVGSPAMTLESTPPSSLERICVLVVRDGLKSQIPQGGQKKMTRHRNRTSDKWFWKAGNAQTVRET